MKPRHQEFYAKLKNLAYRLSSFDILVVYFQRMIVEMERCARSSDIPGVFLVLVKSLECIEKEINLYLTVQFIK